MKAEIITVGTELLMGQILNTNAQFLAQQINGLGINHHIETVVGDNPDRLTKVLDQAKDRSEIIIITGGLGPTRDDLTKEILADYLSINLIGHEPTVLKIKDYFDNSDRQMSHNNKKMALTFEKGESFMNEVGQAVGTAIEKDGILYILLPGPPSELRPMFNNEVRPYLIEYIGENAYITSMFLNYYGIGESDLATHLDDVIKNQTNPTVAIYINEASVSIRLTTFGDDLSENKKRLEQTRDYINGFVGEWYYGEGYNYTLADALFDYLKENEETISFAESLTGGEAANQLVNVEGSSAVFRGSIVAYDAHAKENALGVKKETLDKYGTVSAECAREMAENAAEKFNTTIGVSFTGVAGPAPLEGHKAGTVFVGIARENEETQIVSLHLWGGRQGVRLRAINSAFVELIKKDN